MHKLTPHSRHLAARQLHRTLPLSVLALISTTSASAAMLEIPAIRDGLNLGIYGSVGPNFTTESNKFNYTHGDPNIFGSDGTIADVLANQDRKDSDEQLRLNGLNWGSVEFYASQKLTPKITANGSILIEASESYSSNWGAYWGMWLDFGSYGEKGRISIGGRNNGLGVSQTGLGMLNTLNDAGTNINGRYTGIPNLTLSAYHMFTQASDINNNRATGWHRSDGVSAKYDFEFAPRKSLTLAGGYGWNRGHDQMAYWDVAERADAYLLGVGFQHNDWTVGLDYGWRDETYNGYMAHSINRTTYGTKVDYEFTPRLKGTFSYGHSESDNTSPAPIQRLVSWGTLEPNSGLEAFYFDKVKQDRYSAGLSYQLHKGITLNGSVTNLKTKNYADEGEFSNREQLSVSAGATFSF